MRTDFSTIPFLFRAKASLISGIKRIDTEFKRVEGKNKRGRAIPFIIPNCERAREEFAENFERFFGTKMFSAVLRPEFKYLPEVIGRAIFIILFVTL